MGASAQYAASINVGLSRIQNSDGTNFITMLTAGASGSLIQGITVSSTDGTTRTVRFYLTNGGIDYLLCTIDITGNSGNANTTPAIDVLRHVNLPGISYDMAGNKQLRIGASTTLRMAAGATITAATFIAAVVDAENL